MQAAKISLSPQELKTAADAGVILTKNSVIKKAQLLLGQAALQAVQLYETGKLVPPPEAAAIAPKISRGENYRGLPWVMLDYPRYFSKNGVFAIRSLFWWGHYFTCTLHLGGVYKTAYQATIARAYEQLCTEGWLVYTGNHEWQHHLETGYTSITALSGANWGEQLDAMPFIKLTRQWPLQQWATATEFFGRCYNSLAQITGL